MSNKINLAIQKGLSFLAKSFPYANELSPRATASKDSSQPFFPIPLILTCLDCLKNETHDSWPATQLSAMLVINKAANKDGTFNYHTPTHGGQQKIYPDDLDDTALAYAAQQLYAPEGLSGQQLACFAQSLIRAETAVGGPYNTWLTDWHSDGCWADIDPVVNANIAFALSLQGVHMPGLDTYFNEYLRAEHLTSRYYQSPLTILYFISRAFGGAEQKRGVKIIHSLQKNGVWSSPQASALAVCSLLRWGKPQNLESTIEYLLATQTEGFWDAEKLFIESGAAEKQTYYGSRAVTTAFCLEALTLYREHLNTRNISKQQNNDSSLFEEIIKKNNGECYTISPSFGNRMAQESARLLTHPFWRETVLWSKRTATALKNDNCLPRAELCNFGVAQLSGLIGYGLIDRIIDQQAPVSDLPFALFATRRCAALYAQLWPGASENILSGIELTLEAEAHSTLPTNVAGKSLGCALPALAVFNRYSEQNNSLTYFKDYFLKLLEARQWNDDAHDYLEDIAAHRLTPVIQLLENLYAHNSLHTTDTLTSLPVKQLQLFIWNKAFPEICRIIDDCLVNAGICLDSTKLPDPSYFQSLLRKQKMALDNARKKQALNLSFLEAMNAMSLSCKTSTRQE